MSRLLMLAAWLSVALAADVQAAPFYLRYDADETFPEQEGWSRSTTGPADEIERGVADSVFWLDTRASLLISDVYFANDQAMELQANESLHVNWTMRTVETDTFGGISDVMLGIANADRQYVELFLAPEFVSEQGEAPPGEPTHLYPIEPGRKHTYSFITADMATYELHVDGQFAFEGEFHGYAWTPGPHVAFGDTIIGRSSLSEWNFVEVEVVPEPASGWVLGILLVLIGRPRLYRNWQ